VRTGRATAAVTDKVLSALSAYGTLDELPRILSAVRIAVGGDVAGYSILRFARIPSTGRPHLLMPSTSTMV
jgi:hypothetical protein